MERRSRLTTSSVISFDQRVESGQVRLDQGPFLVSEVSTRHGDGLPASELKAQANPSDLNSVQALVALLSWRGWTLSS